MIDLGFARSVFSLSAQFELTRRFGKTAVSAFRVNNFKFDQTSEPVQWLRIPSAIRLFGLSRAKLYELISANEIKSVCVRKRGHIKGCRLISAESLANYIESFSEESASRGGQK